MMNPYLGKEGDPLSEILSGISEFMMNFAGLGQGVTTILRLLFPILAIIILIRCGISLLRFHKEPEIWCSGFFPTIR